MNQVRSRNWAFTHNNYVEDSIDKYKALPKIKYLVIGKEVGESGTPHLQGTIVFTDAKSFNAVRKIMLEAGQPHIGACKDLQASIKYCKKDGDFIEVGNVPMTQEQKGQVEKERWSIALENAKKGKFEEIDAQIQVSQCRNLDFIYSRELASKKFEDTTVRHQWYYGPTGTGKSRTARTENPDAYLKMCNKWWDHYKDEDVVLIEDLDKKHDCLAYHLKIWADRYQFLAEIKGGSRKIRPKLIIVTSNYHPREIWPEEADLEPILRRFHVRHFDNPF